MKRLFVAFLISILMPALCFGKDIRTVTDHAGYIVDVPKSPLRIVSLSDWTTTLMAHELGVEVVASVGRRDGNGYYIRGGRELFGLEFDERIDLASVHSELDLERIAALKPDLIIGLRSDTIAYRDQLSHIAPVLLFDIANGRNMLENYRDFASWLGKDAEFNALKATFDSNIQRQREILKGVPSKSYIVLRFNPKDGDITIYRDFGAVTVVLNDLGFSPMPIVAQIPAGSQHADFSPEMIAQMDADYIFTGHMEDRGQTAKNSMDEMEAVAPGASGFLHAVREKHFVSVSRFHVSPPTFAALDYFLSRLW
ncbi:ABC transporter substrate-binding protein [Brucellaceae bacterium D45D]